MADYLDCSAVSYLKEGIQKERAAKYAAAARRRGRRRMKKALAVVNNYMQSVLSK